MKKIKLIIWLVLLITAESLCQNLEWKHFENSLDRVYALKSDREFMWIGTESGIVRINTNTNEMDFYVYQNLPSSWIISIAVDKSGNKWFGANGLLKYNDSEFEIYNTSNSEIPDNHVSGISIDSKGNIWVGTWDGIAKFDGNDWTVFKTSNSGLPDHEINSIAVDKNDIIWIGTANKGIVRFDGQNWSIYDTNNSPVLNNYIRVVKVDSVGNKFIVPAYGGIVKYNDTTWTHYEAPGSVADIRWIDFDKDNIMWIATTGGLVKFDRIHFTIFNKSNSSILTENLGTLAFDYKGNIWIGSSHLASVNSHLQKFDGTNWTAFNTNSAYSTITDNTIESIAVDSTNVKWITNGDGIVKYDNGLLTRYDFSNSELPNSFMHKVVVDKFNIKWITTGNGLVKYNNQNWSIYQPNFFNDFRSIFIDDKNHKWVIAYYFAYTQYPIWGYQLFEFNDTTWVNHSQKNNYTIGGEYKYLNSILVDKNGYIWIGSDEGLIRYDGLNKVIFNTINSDIPSDFISEIAPGENNEIWIGTNKGIAVINEDNSWTVFNKSNSGLQSDTINTIAVDKLGNKWIGTDKGLVRYDSFNWKIYGPNNSGLYAGQSVSSIAIDREMNKWFGTWGDLIEYTGEKTNIIDKKYLEYKLYLFQNYPNPFNVSTTISFFIKGKQQVTLKIYDVLGREITKLLDEEKAAGIYKVWFNGNGLASGVYFYRLNAGPLSETKKFVLLK